MNEIESLTDGEADEIDNSSPAFQNVQLGHKIKALIDAVNQLLTDDTPGK